MKLPTHTGRAGIKEGEQVLGIVCRNDQCQHRMALGGQAEELPDEFEVECPRCQQTEKYQKAEIQILTAHTKQ